MDVLRHHRYLQLLFFVLVAYFVSCTQQQEFPHRHRHHHGAPRRNVRQYNDESGPEYYYLENAYEPERGTWGPWISTGLCTRECGGGVAYQTRECLSLRSDGSSACTGSFKRYFSCNIQDCPDVVDFRAQQCSTFDSIPFEGIHYTWVPYTKATNKCELNCMPRGERFYYRHKKVVIDGTLCDDEKLDICVNGKCLPVGCDKLLGSPKREDKCRVCGGDNSDCETQTGILNDDNYQVGYNDLLLVPRGAMNVRIRELKPSNNYLAIRNKSNHYYLNGNWRIDYTKPFHACGTIFHYNRSPRDYYTLESESISALGPLNEAIYIVLLYQERNTGVEYEYSIGNGIVVTPPTDGYYWAYGPMSNCSAICGGGFKTRDVWCAKRRDSSRVSTDLCDPALQPISNQSCAQEACPPRWIPSAWSNCSMSCGMNGTQNRTVQCLRIVSNDPVRQYPVDEYYCQKSEGAKLETKRPCNIGAPCPKWFIGPWKPCNKLCGDGLEKRDVVCHHKNGSRVVVVEDNACPEAKPEYERKCFKRPCEGVDWLISDWTACEEKCDLNFQTRRAVCSSLTGKIYPNEFCNVANLPDLKRECEDVAACGYQWYASQWSQCSSKCGAGIKSRKVFCGALKGESIEKVADSKCESDGKYRTEENCTGTGTCVGDWFAGPWSECSKKCGGGQMTRKVLCFVDNRTADATECHPEKIVFSSESCNEKKCGEDEIIAVSDATTTVHPESVEDDLHLPYCDELDVETKIKKGGIDSFTDERTDDYQMKITVPDTPEMPETGTDMMQAGTELYEGETTIFPESTTEDFNSTTAESTTYFTSTLDFNSTTDFSTTEFFFSSSTEGSSSLSSKALSPSVKTVSEVDNMPTQTDQQKSFEITTKDATIAAGTTEAVTTIKSETESEKTSNELPSTTTGITFTTMSTFSTSYPSSSVSSTTTDDMSSTMQDLTSSTVDMSSTTEGMVSSSTKSISSTTVNDDISSTMQDLTSTTMDMSITGGIVSSSMMSLSSTTINDISSTMQDLTSTTMDMSSTVEGMVSSSTKSISSTTIDDMSSTTQDLTSTTMGMSTESMLSSLTVGISSRMTDSSYTSMESHTTSPEPDTISITSSVTLENVTTSTVGTTAADTTVSDMIVVTTDETTTSGSTSEEGNTRVVSTFITTKMGIWTTTMQVSTATEPPDVSIITTVSDNKNPLIWFGYKNKCKERKVFISRCEKSKYGCCADGITPSNGPFSAGCSEIKTCNETKFGCCPDGVSVAQGSNYARCPKENCAKTLYGCCPDGRHTAQGNDMMGCPVMTTRIELITTTESTPIISSWSTSDIFHSTSFADCNSTIFGCCPDGISVPSGKNNEGCDDNMDVGSGEPPCNESTAGPNRTDCLQSSTTDVTSIYSSGTELASTDSTVAPICEDWEFGCCPDNVTFTHGPNGEGCCLTSKYGCCPDNIAEAAGPNLENCPAFGLCPDGVTRARGDGLKGCECEHTPFGCCSDGKTPATNISRVCSCDASRYGCCPDGVTEARGDDFQGCVDAPIKPGEACVQVKDRGPCRDFTVKWFFDSEYGGCSRFWYGGCEGNGNRFKSQDDCIGVCVSPKGRDACSLPKVAGPCEGYYPTWFYDAPLKQCRQFIYGGCLGNNNKFQTRQECEQTCAASEDLETCVQPPVEGPCKGNFTRWFYNAASGQCETFKFGGCKPEKNNFLSLALCQQECNMQVIHKEECFLPVIKGSCNKQLPRWHFNSTSKKCVPFYYSGCDGNSNNYISRKICERNCPPKYEEDVCTLPKTPGDCDNYTRRWYYEGSEHRCRQFFYGGCGGNGNNFESERECRQHCSKHARAPSFQYEFTPPPAPPTPEPITRGINPPSVAPYINPICLASVDPGPCLADIPSWYFDASGGRCQLFGYGGCEGNANRFQSEEQCERQCGIFQRTDICSLELKPGSCDAYAQKWYFDKAEGACKAYWYTGCDGNGNRFGTEEECRAVCLDKDEPMPPPDKGGPYAMAVCKLPVDVGVCEGGNFKRWYYDEVKQACIPFIYSGCAGNLNRFKSYQDCALYCLTSAPTPPSDKCAAAKAECNGMRHCSYGIQRWVDNEDECERCRCHDPCVDTDIHCPAQTQCAIEVYRHKESGGARYKPVCRQINKPGECPLSNIIEDRECEDHCRTDADCPGSDKCCSNDCAMMCAQPIDVFESPIRTTSTTPASAVAVVVNPRPQAPYMSPAIVPFAEGEEGGYVTMECIAFGYPIPIISWSFMGVVPIGKSTSHYKLSENTLQIVGLYKSDAGIYVCTAENGVGEPARQEFTLVVKDGKDKEADVLNTTSNALVVSLFDPLTLHCFAFGWPRPTVTWWKEDKQIITSELYEQLTDHSLNIKRVTLQSLGPYTCQAYNGFGRAASWSMSVHGVGSLDRPLEPEEEKYAVYLVPSSSAKDVSGVSGYVPPSVIHPTRRTTASPVVTTTEYRVLVQTKIPVNATMRPYGSEIYLPCEVEGYPPPRVSWFKNNNPLHVDSKIRIDENYHLTIINAQVSDSGTYKCLAENAFSSAYSTIDITVEGVYIHPNCTDRNELANCTLIARYQRCNHIFYKRICCRTCTLLGQIPPQSYEDQRLYRREQNASSSDFYHPSNQTSSQQTITSLIN